MEDIALKLVVSQLPRSPKDARAPLEPKTRNPVHFIPTVPLAVIKACAVEGCEVVLPLVLAIHRQLKMTGRDWTPLNRAVWVSAGDPPEKKRERILRLLKAQPELVQIRSRKTATSHYDVAYGAAWHAHG
jgi:hypothetical protein